MSLFLVFFEFFFGSAGGLVRRSSRLSFNGLMADRLPSPRPGNQEKKSQKKNTTTISLITGTRLAHLTFSDADRASEDGRVGPSSVGFDSALMMKILGIGRDAR